MSRALKQQEIPSPPLQAGRRRRRVVFVVVNTRTMLLPFIGRCRRRRAIHQRVMLKKRFPTICSRLVESSCCRFPARSAQQHVFGVHVHQQARVAAKGRVAKGRRGRKGGIGKETTKKTPLQHYDFKGSKKMMK